MRNSVTTASPEQRDYTSIFRLDGRKVVVVGGGSGLGRASSIALAQFGATVVAQYSTLIGTPDVR
jgi:hypothetical protein